MPQTIEIPTCLREFLSRLYADIDVDSLTFHRGVPPYSNTRGAITIGSHMYFREHRTDFCSRKDVALAAHEVYHVHQGSAAPGVWFLRPFYARYVWQFFASGFKTGRKHPLEIPAYALQERVKEQYDRAAAASGESGPCACEGGEPIGVNEAFLDAFFAEWPGLDG
jgi:hypothetical protein